MNPFDEVPKRRRRKRNFSWSPSPIFPGRRMPKKRRNPIVRMRKSKKSENKKDPDKSKKSKSSKSNKKRTPKKRVAKSLKLPTTMSVRSAKRLLNAPRSKGRPPAILSAKLKLAKQVLKKAGVSLKPKNPPKKRGRPAKKRLAQKHKRPRGRPRTKPIKTGPKRPRGRPRTKPTETGPKRPRGRPRKKPPEEEERRRN